MDGQTNRREFLSRLGAGAFGLSPLIYQEPGLWLAKAFAAEASAQMNKGALVNIVGANLNFGTTLYPWRSQGNNDPNWSLGECRALGLTEIRVGPPRDHFEHGQAGYEFNPHLYYDANPEIMDLLRQSRFDVIMTIHGHPRDAAGKRVLDWPRNADGTINGAAAGPAFAFWTRWLVNHTKDFVGTYELWNEAFGKIEDQEAKKSFGPGGSKENADNYAAMMQPAMKAIRTYAPKAKVTVEGNYWNLDRSVEQSPAFIELLKQADYVVRHPYGYQPQSYELSAGGPGRVTETMQLYKKYNPRLQWWYSEYGVSGKDVGLESQKMRGIVQAKALLRATLLHLRHDIRHLDLFDLYYPSTPHFNLVDDDRSRRPAWYMYQRLIAACAVKKPGTAGKLIRSNKLPEQFADLAVSTSSGFTYMIWQETGPGTFKNMVAAIDTKVVLQSAEGRPLRLLEIVDPISGETISCVRAIRLEGGQLELVLPVKDYPYFCKLVSE